MQLVIVNQNRQPHYDCLPTNEFIDENNINHIIKQYLKYWKELIIYFKISLDLNISKQCLHYLKCQFMQIKCTPNIKFA